VRFLQKIYADAPFSISILYAALLYIVAAVHKPGSRHHRRWNVHSFGNRRCADSTLSGWGFAIRRWARWIRSLDCSGEPRPRRRNFRQSTSRI